jgi:uncharacterized protein YkwD
MMGWRRLLVVPVLASAACAACMVQVGEGPWRGGAEPATVPAAEVPHAAMVAEVHLEVNRARTDAGAPALTPATALDHVAAEHAQELAVRRVLDHSSVTPTRRTLAMRIEAGGVAWRSIAENLAQVPGASGVVARQTVRLWLNSSSHRRNLLDPALTHSGVGIARDEAGVWYVVQVYVLPARRE